MKRSLILPIQICILISLCSLKGIGIDEGKCYLLKETLEQSPIRMFLDSTENYADIITSFKMDSNKYSILIISGDNISYSYLDDGKIWKVSQWGINGKHEIEDGRINSLIENYAQKNIVYKIECPEDYIIYGGSHKFQAMWIKEDGKIKFIYYTIKCGIECLNDDDKGKISPLLELTKLFHD